jgi:hypothetical protein
MPRFARLLWLFPSVLLPAAVVGTACGTDPVAVEGCRKIEYARCEAAPSCPALGVDDVKECKRFYRDQCLHGLAVADDPGDPLVAKCVGAIQLAGTCAASGAVDCQLPAVSVAGATACDIVQRPEITTDCTFLAPTAPISTAPTLPGSGGAGGEAGGAGASGEAGAAGADATQ